MTIPKAFISYSHDSQEHKKWILELATRLRNNGIDAILDQFELKAGDDVPHFVETQLAVADNILMICTNRYVEKANQGIGDYSGLKPASDSGVYPATHSGVYPARDSGANPASECSV